MKKLPLLAVVLALSFVALLTASNAAVSAAFTGLSGDYVISGSLYLDNDAADNGSFLQAAGVGNVTEIRHSDGTLVWENSLSELSIAFGGFNRTALAPGLGGTTQFTSNGGFVDFYSNSLGTFQATGNYVADLTAIAGGNLELVLEGIEDPLGNVAVGQFSDTSYSSNGFLEVVSGGAFADNFDTNTIDLGNNIFADMSFNISGDNLATAGYDYSGSADLAVSTVPTPGSMYLLGTGLFGFGMMGRRKKS